jgi:uncharacterized membrane protein
MILSTHLALLVAVVATIGCDRVTKHVATTALFNVADVAIMLGVAVLIFGERRWSLLSNLRMK